METGLPRMRQATWLRRGDVVTSGEPHTRSNDPEPRRFPPRGQANGHREPASRGGAQCVVLDFLLQRLRTLLVQNKVELGMHADRLFE